MKRILIIGSPGAGKSTLGRKLQEKTGLPLFHLDLIWHRPDKTNISPEEFDIRLEEILKEDAWIIDGNYARTLKRRIEACDTILYLNYPVSLCLKSIRGRIGQKRPDLPWAEEQLDPEFEHFVKTFPENEAGHIRSALEKAGKNHKAVLEFTSREQAQKWLDSLDSLDSLKMENPEEPEEAKNA